MQWKVLKELALRCNIMILTPAYRIKVYSKQNTKLIKASRCTHIRISNVNLLIDDVLLIDSWLLQKKKKWFIKGSLTIVFNVTVL